MFPRRASTWFAWALLAALFGASVIGCGSPSRAENSATCGQPAHSHPKRGEGGLSRSATKAFTSRGDGDEGSAEKANPLRWSISGARTSCVAPTKS
jgi:hypothetical protein